MEIKRDDERLIVDGENLTLVFKPFRKKTGIYLRGDKIELKNMHVIGVGNTLYERLRAVWLCTRLITSAAFRDHF